MRWRVSGSGGPSAGPRGLGSGGSGGERRKAPPGRRESWMLGGDISTNSRGRSRKSAKNGRRRATGSAAVEGRPAVTRTTVEAVAEPPAGGAPGVRGTTFSKPGAEAGGSGQELAPIRSPWVSVGNPGGSGGAARQRRRREICLVERAERRSRGAAPRPPKPRSGRSSGAGSARLSGGSGRRPAPCVVGIRRAGAKRGGDRGRRTARGDRRAEPAETGARRTPGLAAAEPARARREPVYFGFRGDDSSERASGGPRRQRRRGAGPSGGVADTRRGRSASGNGRRTGGAKRRPVGAWPSRCPSNTDAGRPRRRSERGR